MNASDWPNMPKKKIEKSSIRNKLNVLTLFTLVGAVVLFLTIGGVLGVLSGSRHFSQSKARLETDLLNKGMTLVANNGVALRGIVEDNAFSALREIVVTTVKQDSDMVYGIFMDEDRKPWFMTSDTVQGQQHRLDDSVSIWAQGLKIPGHRIIWNKKNNVDIIEFAAPIFDNDRKNLGVIRYGISTGRTMKQILIERNNSITEGVVSISVFSFFAAAVLFIGLRIARRQAKNITMPVELLTNAAHMIAQGNYDLAVTAMSNDEIGSLAEHFEKMRTTIKEYTGNLEKMVADRTRELREAQKELVEKAHKAGMADIAAGTLHNVGNLLNSVKASIEAIEVIIDDSDSPVQGFSKANKLLGDNIDRLDEFICTDPRGKKLMHYFLKLEEPMRSTCDTIGKNVQRLADKVNSINNVIAAQQSYAGVGGFSENVRLADIVEDAITMQSGSIERHDISIIRDYSDVPDISIQKTKLLHILVNLIKNAKDAMLDTSQDNRSLLISIKKDTETVCIRIQDSGCGIPRENLKKIFSHGFTTKKTGHGFGLHSSANYMKEMGGEMWAESEGPGKGATFVLKFNDRQDTVKTVITEGHSHD